MDLLLERSLAQLNEITGLHVRPVPKRNSKDLTIHLLVGTRATTLHTTIVAAPTFEMLLARKTQHSLFVVPQASRELLTKASAEGINLLDASGNCTIRARGLILYVEGRPAIRRHPDTKAIRAAGWWCVLALLARPSLAEATIRDLAAAAGVSTQAAFDVQKRLSADGALIRSPNGYRWVPSQWRRYIDQWVGGYQAYVRPKLLLGRFRAQGELSDVEERVQTMLPAAAWRWGGESAARRLAPHVEPSAVVLHLQEDTARTHMA
ncbi:MAG TPA: type IV toxin-antitoxin system AbiEi family antitoxin, partial [Kofleriaceae bacterium]|nr:type IV toxin-antitoxin system AbiEi family antitoxin [Kofleriaceae bacterium]